MVTTSNNDETPRPERKPASWRENRWEIAGYGEPDHPLADDGDDYCDDYDGDDE